MGCTQEVSATLDSHQVDIGGVLKQYEFMVRVIDRIDGIFSPLDKVSHITTSLYPKPYMQPHNRTADIEQSRMQAIPISQVDSRHANPPPTIIATVIFADSLAPEVARLGGTALAKADVNQEIAVGETGFEIGRWSFARPLVDAPGE